MENLYITHLIKKFLIIKLQRDLKKILYGGSFFSYEIPSLYQGIIKDVILEIISEYGTCFQVLVLILLSAIAISSKVKKFVTWQSHLLFREPPLEGSAEGYSHSHKGPLSDRKYIVDQLILAQEYLSFSAQHILCIHIYLSKFILSK